MVRPGAGSSALISRGPGNARRMPGDDDRLGPSLDDDVGWSFWAAVHDERVSWTCLARGDGRPTRG